MLTVTDTAIPPAPFAAPASLVAPRLLGALLTLEGVGGRIVETEAYEATDPASHSFAGETVRNRAMFGAPGTAYVYRSYGLHWCFNIVCARGSAVLIRAIEPTLGLDAMAVRRGRDERRLLCAGPGRLAQALGIDRSHDGLKVDAPPFDLEWAPVPPRLAVGPRIGISKGIATPWRFGVAGSRYLSRPFVR